MMLLPRRRTRAWAATGGVWCRLSIGVKTSAREGRCLISTIVVVGPGIPKMKVDVVTIDPNIEEVANIVAAVGVGHGARISCQRSSRCPSKRRGHLIREGLRKRGVGVRSGRSRRMHILGREGLLRRSIGVGSGRSRRRCILGRWSILSSRSGGCCISWSNALNGAGALNRLVLSNSSIGRLIRTAMAGLDSIKYKVVKGRVGTRA